MNFLTTTFLLLVLFTLNSKGSFSEQHQLPLSHTSSNFIAKGSANGIPEVKDGDIIFQSSKSQQSKAVELATNSVFSHCGIIFI